MLELVFIAFIAFVMLLGVRRPFLWVLLYVYIDILAPQRIGYAIITQLQISLIAFAAAFGGWLLLDRKQGGRFALPQIIMLLLLVYCWWTTQNADFPDNAQTKWDWVWKALVFAIFLPLTITTRLRLEALALTMVLSIGMIVISAGIKTVGGGGGYSNLYFFVNDNSGIYESSTLATVSIAMIPIIAWLAKYGTIFPPDRRVRLFAFALIFACLLIPIGTEARTGLLCIAVLGILLLRRVKRRALFMAAGAALGLAAIPFLPQSYFDRMSTIGQPSGDQSASTRLAVWQWTFDYANENPMGGGFDAYRGNSFTYTMPVETGEGNTRSVTFQKVEDNARAYHSSIFEMLGEQGWPGLFLWLALHGLGLWRMEMLSRKWRDKTGEDEQWQAPLAVALQLAHVVYLVGSLFQGIAYQPVILMLLSLQCAFWSYLQRRSKPPAARPKRRAIARPSVPSPIAPPTH